MLDHKWDIVDAVIDSPLFGTPQLVRGLDLADVEEALLAADDMAACERERLLKAVRELGDVYVALS